MAGSLEGNKIVAAVLTAGIIASGSGFIARVLYSPASIEENAFPVVVAAGEQQQESEPEVEPIAVRLASATVEAGETVVTKCSSCHSFDDGGAVKVGPNLYNVVGKPIGQGSYDYSEALSGHGGDWTYENLDGFLANPREWAPGTKMSFAGLTNPEQRADAIMYLRSLSSDPMALPEAPAAEASSEDTNMSDNAAGDETAEGSPPAESTSDTASSDEGAVKTGTESADNQATSTEATQSDQVMNSSSTEEDSSIVKEASAEPEDEEIGSPTTSSSADASTSSSDQSEPMSPKESTIADTPKTEAEGASGDSTQVAAVSTSEGGAPETSQDDSQDSPLNSMLASADASAGESTAKKCMACHTFNEGGPNRVGPNLYGVVDSEIAGRDNGYSYSKALAGHGGEWSYQNLNAFLTNPREWAPGTKMTFAGIKSPEERANVIAYLRTLSASPPPLP